MKAYPLLFFVLSASLLSCDSFDKVSYDDLRVVDELFDYIEGDGHYSVVTEIIEDTTEYIEVKIEKSKYLQDQPLNSNQLTNKELIASISASFLYHNLENETTQEFEGINIVFEDGKPKSIMDKTHYYSMSDLARIHSNFNQIFEFINSFGYGNSPFDYVQDPTDSNLIDAINEIEMRKLNEAEFVSFLHQDFEEPDQYGIYGIYKDTNGNQFLIEYWTVKEAVKNPIDSIAIKK